MKVMICGGDEVVNTVLDFCKSTCLKVIVSMRPDIKPKTLERSAELQIKVVKFKEVEKYGCANISPELVDTSHHFYCDV